MTTLVLGLVLAVAGAWVLALEGGLEDFLELPAAFMQGSCSVFKRSANCSLAGPQGFAARPQIQPRSSLRQRPSVAAQARYHHVASRSAPRATLPSGNNPFQKNIAWRAG